MSDSPNLTTDLLAKPEFANLYIRLGETSFDVMVYNPLEEHSLIYRSIDISGDTSADKLKALENAIYDNPLLLADFRRTRIIVESRHLAVVPDEEVSAGERRSVFDKIHPDNGVEMVESGIEGLGATVLAGIDADTLRFIRRTFNAAPVTPAIAIFANYCRSSLNSGNTVKAFVNLREGSLDIAVLSHERLYLLNRFEWRDINDAVYYILAATDPGALPCDITEISLSGNREVRESIMPMLRRFRPLVMPAIFPSAMYRAGADAMKAEFDHAIMPLCE